MNRRPRALRQEKNLGVMSFWVDRLKEPPWMIHANAAPLAIAFLGLLLGMRHAMDRHVI
jgi:hypothetical protein